MLSSVKVLTTLPSVSKHVKVRVLGMHASIEEDFLEAYADVEEYVPYYPRVSYSLFKDTSFRYPDEPVSRKGRARLTLESLNELGNSNNNLYLVEESHIEWEN